MNASSTHLPYGATGFFSAISIDYTTAAAALRDFYSHPPNTAGIEAAIKARNAFSTDRQLLADTLRIQYAAYPDAEQVQQNIDRLLLPNTYTICTAHQPNIFTGHLYFIYKIIHAVKLADTLTRQMPDSHFVPVYYMGSEDADLDELGEVTVNGTRYQWKTPQTGAVGRMLADDDLLAILDAIAGELLVLPHGPELIELVRSCYTKNNTIEQATFRLVHALFARYGLLVFLPDQAVYKQKMIALFTDDLLHHTPGRIVEETSARLEAQYKAQAFPRPINLFYLKDNIRERIEKDGDAYVVLHTDIRFSQEALLQELQAHPERFSPNVILRGLFQETLLPNIAFIGGGGELAYWLQLKDLFVHYNIPYPVQVLRNSFLLLRDAQVKQWAALKFAEAEYFLPATELLNILVKRESSNTLTLNSEKATLEDFYHALCQTGAAVDQTLLRHIEALKVKAIQKLDALEKKLLRAEKRKFEAAQRHIHLLKTQLFPGNGLQERVENLLPFYALLGKELMSILYAHSLTLEQEFTLLKLAQEP